jgi:predicted RNA methylase
MTPPNIAANVLLHILDVFVLKLSSKNEEIQEQNHLFAADFGCGTGMLSCGLMYIGIEYFQFPSLSQTSFWN